MTRHDALIILCRVSVAITAIAVAAFFLPMKPPPPPTPPATPQVTAAG